MNTEIYQFRYRLVANRRYLGILLAQMPVVFPLACWHMPDTRLTAIALSVATRFTTALLIHAGKGGPEWHFDVFASLAALIMLADPFSILAAAGTIAVHHVFLFLAAPTSLFNYHAAFVVAETIPIAITARALARATMAEAIATAQLSGQSESLNHHGDRYLPIRPSTLAVISSAGRRRRTKYGLAPSAAR